LKTKKLASLGTLKGQNFRIYLSWAQFKQPVFTNMDIYKFLIFTVSIFLIAGCDFEDTYVDVCSGKYSTKKLKDSLAIKYKIDTSNIDSKQRQKVYFAGKHNCDTIKLEISSDNITYFSSDIFALSLARIFFSDTLNKDVNSLDLTLDGYWSSKFKENEDWGNDRRCFIRYRVDKDSIEHYDLSNELVEEDSMRYDIISERPFSHGSSDITNEGLDLTVKVKKDYKNFTLLADQIKDKYQSVIDKNRISSFLIEMMVDSPSCRLCSSKSYEFSYVMMQYLKR
jgi:hypothetical protein